MLYAEVSLKQIIVLSYIQPAFWRSSAFLVYSSFLFTLRSSNKNNVEATSSFMYYNKNVSIYVQEKGAFFCSGDSSRHSRHTFEGYNKANYVLSKNL